MAKIASIYVKNLKTTDKYVDTVVAECYSDPGFTTLVGVKTSAVVWDGSTYNVQKDIILFSGLTLGATYYLKVAFSNPITGTQNSTWSTNSVVAGDTTAPACTYSATLTQTPAGVNVEVTPGSVPSDLDHYEATWTTNSSTAPAVSDVAKLTRLTVIGGGINFFCGAKPNDVVRVYMRAVDTSGNRQAWTLVNSTTTTTPTLSDIHDTLNHYGVCSGGGGNYYDYRQISTVAYTIVSGDRLEYDIFLDPSCPDFTANVDFYYNSSTNYFRGASINDQNGLAGAPTDLSAYAKGKWYHRIFDLTSLAGQTTNSWAIALEGNAAGSYLIKYANIKITNGTTVKAVVFTSGQLQGSMWNVGVWAGGGTTGYSGVKTFTSSIADGVMTSSGPFRTQGSTPPQAIGASASFSGGNAYVTVTITGGTIYMPDGTTYSISSSGPTNYTTWASTTVANGTTYSCNVCYQISSNSVVLQQYVGSPSVTTKKDAYADGLVAIMVGGYYTPSSGGGTGGGGGGVCFSGNTRSYLAHGNVAFSDLDENSLAQVRTKNGWRWAKLLVHDYDGPMYDMGDGELVTPKHPFWVNDQWLAAETLFSGNEIINFKGKVYSWQVLTDDEEDRNFLLANGHIVHNQSII